MSTINASQAAPLPRQQAINSLEGMLGGAVGQAVANVVQGAQSLQQLQDLQKLVDTARGQMTNCWGDLSKHGGAGGLDGKPGAISPGNIAIIVMNSPLSQLAGHGESQGPVTAIKHARAPIVSGSPAEWQTFSNVASTRITGSRPIYDGSNPWAKTGEARDEAGLVGWAMAKTDNIQYDSDRKMFFQTNTNGTKTDVISLSDLKKTADAAGGVDLNNGAGFDAVGRALDQASAKASAGRALEQQPPSIDQLISQLKDLVDKLNGGASANGGASGAASGPAAGGAQGNFSTGGSEGWGKIDSMMAEAEKLSQSDKQSDQLKAQQMMQKATRMFEMISKMLEQMSQMLAKSVQAWR